MVELSSLSAVRAGNRIYLPMMAGGFQVVTAREIKDASSDDVVGVRWLIAIEAAMIHLAANMHWAGAAGWEKRCRNWVIHFRSRHRDQVRRERKPEPLRNPATCVDWMAACQFLAEQAKCRLRKGGQGEWNRWAICATKNSGRKFASRRKGDGQKYPIEG